jgi:hypothetical protein
MPEKSKENTTPFTNLGINWASTKDWLEITKNQSICELVPQNFRTIALASSKFVLSVEVTGIDGK